MEEFNCGICNREFKDASSYNIHMAIHADKSKGRQFPEARIDRFKGKAGYACQYCHKVFPRPHEKVKHERVHTGEKPYACEVCGKTFRVQYSLTLHLRTHTNIRPYACATCNKRFKSHGAYTHHLQTHSNERAYKCDTCAKTFQTAVQLCGHKTIHTKPFSCPICNRPFANLYSVKNHLKTHNKSKKIGESNNVVNQHACRFCGAIYERHYALRLHVKQQHAQEAVKDLKLWQDLELEISENDTDNNSEILLITAASDAILHNST